MKDEMFFTCSGNEQGSQLCLSNMSTALPSWVRDLFVVLARPLASLGVFGFSAVF